MHSPNSLWRNEKSIHKLYFKDSQFKLFLVQEIDLSIFLKKWFLSSIKYRIFVSIDIAKDHRIRITSPTLRKASLAPSISKKSLFLINLSLIHSKLIHVQYKNYHCFERFRVSFSVQREVLSFKVQNIHTSLGGGVKFL